MSLDDQLSKDVPHLTRLVLKQDEPQYASSAPEAVRTLLAMQHPEHSFTSLHKVATMNDKGEKTRIGCKASVVHIDGNRHATIIVQFQEGETETGTDGVILAPGKERAFKLGLWTVRWDGRTLSIE